MYRRLRAALVRRRTLEVGPVRKVRISEDYPSDRFLVIVVLMVVFFVGLSLLEVIHIVFLGSWNEVVFNGIMLVVGTIVGAIWGRQNG
ncbi:hypothetical protein GH157_06975 [archaeon]|nr:hypothetical protein [archaeon]